MSINPALQQQTDVATPPSPLLTLLETSYSILCVSHVNPDGDAIGSLLGLGWILRAMGKRPDLALHDKLDEEYHFLPGADDIISPEEVAQNYDLIVCVDASSIDRMGSVYNPDTHSRIPLLVIDHHVTNTFFGTINWVDDGSAATCQMLLRLADALDIPLSQNIAVSLLTGLVTDTLCFRTANTDANVLQVALRLINAGADLNFVVRNTLESRSFSLLKLWGATLSGVQLEDGVIWTTLSAESRKACGVQPHQSDGLSNLLVTVREADVSATFSQRFARNGQELVECSFRAKPGFNVSQVALAFGGGGHPPAAGCTVPGSLEEVSRRIISALQQMRREKLAEQAASQ